MEIFFIKRVFKECLQKSLIIEKLRYVLSSKYYSINHNESDGEYNEWSSKEKNINQGYGNFHSNEKQSKEFEHPSHSQYGQRFSQRIRPNNVLRVHGRDHRNKNTEFDPILKDIYDESEETKKQTLFTIHAFRKKNGVVIHGYDSDRKPILKLSHCKFPEHLHNSLDEMNFKELLPIQSESWAHILSGVDVIGVCQSGSGKTLTYVLPAIAHIMAQNEYNAVQNISKSTEHEVQSVELNYNQDKLKDPNVVILSPTKEHVQKISEIIQSICGRFKNMKHVCLFGEQYEISQLQDSPQIIIATPQCLMDFILKQDYTVKKCSYFVLDDVDIMLNMGFEQQIRSISQLIRHDRQTSMWTETFQAELKMLANSCMNPHRLKISIR